MGVYLFQEQCNLRDIFISKKQCNLSYISIYKETDTMRYILISKKQYTFRYVYIYIIYGEVLIPNYKRTYDQSNQIENMFELFIENWSYSYDQ